jgi:hypothetical protein
LHCHLSNGTMGVFRGRRYTAPVGSGTAGRDIAAAPGDGTVSRGTTNLVGQTADLCGSRTRQGFGPDQLPRTDRKMYHSRRGMRPTTSQLRTYPLTAYGNLGGRRNTAAGSPAIAGRIVSSIGEKITTYGEGSVQLPRTEGNSHPRNMGVAEAAGVWRPGPTVYGEFCCRLKYSSVTLVTVQMAYLGGGGITPLSARGRRGTTLQPPQWADRIAQARH